MNLLLQDTVIAQQSTTIVQAGSHTNIASGYCNMS